MIYRKPQRSRVSEFIGYIGFIVFTPGDLLQTVLKFYQSVKRKMGFLKSVLWSFAFTLILFGLAIFVLLTGPFRGFAWLHREVLKN